MSEPEQPKNPAGKSRARASDRFIIRAAKKLEKLAIEFSDQDVAFALDRLRKQLNATRQMWDVVKKKMIKIPDEKIRFDAAAMILAYKWGKPVERSVTANMESKDFPGLIAKLNQSPAYLADELCEQKIVESTQSTPASARAS